VVLFVCHVTKAIHLEGVEDYTTADFLVAFRRFVSRRSWPAQLYSDNGANFHGADRELQKFSNNEFKFNLTSHPRKRWYTMVFYPPCRATLWRTLGGWHGKFEVSSAASYRFSYARLNLRRCSVG